jgi:hypothetical protein
MKTIYLTTLMSAFITTHAHAASDPCSSKSKGLVSYSPLTVETRISAISFCDNRSDNQCGFEKTSFTSYKYSDSTEFNERRSWEQSAEMNSSFTFEGVSAGVSGSLKNTLEQSYKTSKTSEKEMQETSKQNFTGQYYEVTFENTFMTRVEYLTNLNQNGWGRAAQGPITHTETVCIRKDYYPIFNAMLQEIWNQSADAQGVEWFHIRGAASVINTMGKDHQFKEYANRVQTNIANTINKNSWDDGQWSRIANSTKDALNYYNKNDAHLAIKNFLAGYQSISAPAHNKDKFKALLGKANYLAQFTKD